MTNDADGPSCSHAASNTNGAAAAANAGAAPPANRGSQIAATGASLPLQRNPSVTSTHSHSSRSVGASGARSRFPASPALSTLSKNSSSGSSSLASAARMSVDDILSNPKLSRGARQKRLRASSKERQINLVAAKPAVVQSSGAVQCDGRRLSNKEISESKPPAKRRLEDPVSNPCAEDRRKRLERLQREQLQRRAGQAPKRKPPQSGLVKLEKMRQDEQSMSSGKLERGESMEGPEDVPSSGEHQLKRQKTTESASSKGGNPGDKGPEPPKPTPRRSKRAQTVASYNVAELAKTNVEPSPLEGKSLPLEVEGKGTAGEGSTAPPPPQSQESMTELEEEPETAEAALEALIVKNEACVGRESQPRLGGATPSPWDVVKMFSILLPHMNLFDSDFLKSDECRRIERDLGGVLKSAERVRHEVMNRDTGDDVEEGSNARLLRMIQIQVWIRMMIWTMENEAGLEFVRRAVALAGDTAETEAVGKKGKGKKKNKKKTAKKGKKSEDVSPRQSVVDDLKAFMDLAPYVLPRSLDFSRWLRDTLTLGFREPIPDYGAELFDHFEISMGEPITLRRHGTDASQQSGRSERSEVSRSPVKGESSADGSKEGSPTKQMMEKRSKRQQAYFASLADEEKANSNPADDESATITGSLSTVTSTSRASSLREKDDIALFQTSVSLTATASTRSRNNPFLKGSARGEYVGTHMSTKLSNISSLFREVKGAPKSKPKTKAVQLAKKKAPPEKRRKDPPERLQARLPSVVASTTAAVEDVARPSAKPSSAITRPLPAPPEETPMKRARPAASSRGAPSRAAPLFSVQETPRPVVEETPAFQRAGGRPFIVAETPQQQSAALPTSLWSARPRSRQPLNLSRPSQRPGRGSSRGRGEQLTPANPSLSFGFSPVPHKEDVASAVADAARAARKRK